VLVSWLDGKFFCEQSNMQYAVYTDFHDFDFILHKTEEWMNVWLGFTIRGQFQDYILDAFEGVDGSGWPSQVGIPFQFPSQHWLCMSYDRSRNLHYPDNCLSAKKGFLCQYQE
jgi:hypothetical protein